MTNNLLRWDHKLWQWITLMSLLGGLPNLSVKSKQVKRVNNLLLEIKNHGNKLPWLLHLEVSQIYQSKASEHREFHEKRNQTDVSVSESDRPSADLLVHDKVSALELRQVVALTAWHKTMQFLHEQGTRGICLVSWRSRSVNKHKWWWLLCFILTRNNTQVMVITLFHPEKGTKA